jgi:molybdate transport system substrate-binding protein
MYFAKLIDDLGIGDAVRGKAVRRPGGLVGELVAAGKAELAVQQIPELMAVPGIQFVGPFPKEVQMITKSAAAVLADAREPAAAKAFLDFLLTPASARVIKAKGHEPAQGQG